MILNSPLKGDNYRRAGAYFEPLRVRAQDAPNLTVKIEAGSFQLQTSELIEYTGGNSPAISVPGSLAHWVAVCLTNNAAIVNVVGTPSANPQQPTIPADHIMLALVYVQAGTTAITPDMVFDARPLFRMGTGDVDHADLLNTSSADSHPIAAITGLQAALDDRVTLTDNTNNLAAKADTTGTVETVFTLNSDATGVPAVNCSLAVERGSSSNVEIRWNETSEVWEYTNDGVGYAPLGGAGLDAEFIDFVPTGSIASTDVQAAIVEVEAAKADTADVADLVTLSGLAVNSTDLGTFTGSTITDNVTVKAALQEIETAHELKADATVVTEIDTNVNDLITLSGVAENAADLGTFTGTTITDNVTNKAALQELETAVEARLPLAGGTLTGDLNMTSGTAVTMVPHADLAALTTAIPTPSDGDVALVRSQGLAFWDGVASPPLWVKASDGTTPIA